MRPAAAHQVQQGQPLTVAWRDGTEVQLHGVLDRGAPSPRLRAVRAGEAWLVVDLLRLHPSLRWDMRDLPARDWPGLIYFTLRLAYGGAHEFHHHVRRHGASVAGESTTTAA